MENIHHTEGSEARAVKKMEQSCGGRDSGVRQVEMVLEKWIEVQTESSF